MRIKLFNKYSYFCIIYILSYFCSYSYSTNLNYINNKLLSVLSGKSKVQAFFAPKVNPGYLFAEIAKKENKKIEMAAFYLTCPTSIDSLFKLAKRGIEVDIVLDIRSYKYKEKDIDKLIKNGIKCWVYNTKDKELMHNKFIIFYNCFDDKNIVWTGSSNFTYGATNNKENIIIIRSKQLLKSYAQEFRELKKESKKIRL